MGVDIRRVDWNFGFGFSYSFFFLGGGVGFVFSVKSLKIKHPTSRDHWEFVCCTFCVFLWKWVKNLLPLRELIFVKLIRLWLVSLFFVLSFECLLQIFMWLISDNYFSKKTFEKAPEIVFYIFQFLIEPLAKIRFCGCFDFWTRTCWLVVDEPVDDCCNSSEPWEACWNNQEKRIKCRN